MDKKGDEGKKPMTMRVAFVDRENRGGQQMYRMQMIMTQERKQQIMQTVTPWGPEALGREFDTEIVMKMGDQPAVVMPIKADKEPGSGTSGTSAPRSSSSARRRSTVPAGEYKARHYRAPTARAGCRLTCPAGRS